MSEETDQLSVPPGFRFHPTDEELLYYYLRKKVSCEAIDLDVIREVDLNKLEPWDLKDKCRIGSDSQHEWYFFSHKDKKYPTGTRTNRATTVGFWKATGRDKAIHLHSNSKRIGLRKTLVFYTGRAPHGQKTDWIMHEYRLDDEYSNATTPSEVGIQEDGWVVCRVFKKKNHNRSLFEAVNHQEHTFYAEEDHHHLDDQDMNKHGSRMQTLHSYNRNITSNTTLFDGSMHLPQLLTSPHEHVPYLPTQHQSRSSDLTTTNNISSSNNINSNNNKTSTMMVNDMQFSKNLLSLMSMSHGGLGCSSEHQSHDKPLFATSNHANVDWSFLDKLLASNQHHSGLTFGHQNQQGTSNDHSSSQHYPHDMFHIHNYLGHETDILKFAK